MCGLCLNVSDHSTKQAPEVTSTSSGSDNDITETHPAYAQLSIHRTTRHGGDGNTLYGSAIKHQSTISMIIAPSEKHTNSYMQSYYASNRPYIEVEMSQSQFSEAITSMNMGGGVPVTLRSLRGDVIPMCIEQTVQDLNQSHLNDQLNELAKTIGRFDTASRCILGKKGTITVADKKKLMSMYSTVIQEMNSNLPFLNECLQETLDKNTNAAKAEIEAFMLNTITNLGLDALERNGQVPHIDGYIS